MSGSTPARVRLNNILTQVRKKNRRQARNPPPPLHQTYNIVRGDKVQVIGKHPDAGKQGIVTAVIRAAGRVIVEGVNVRNKFVKGNPERGIPGRTTTKEHSIPYASVSLLDPISNKPTRIYKTFQEDGTKVRISKKSGEVIPRPEILKLRKRPVNTIVTPSDTSNPDDVWEITYDRFIPKTAPVSHPL